jgi:cholera toxin transcriptional activator
MSKIGIKYVLAKKYIFDPSSNSLVDQAQDDTIRLGSNESRILTILCEHANEVITRDQLHEYVWRDQGFQVDDSSLTQAISTLRKMLKDSTKSPQFVKTVPKRGYQLICSVESPMPTPKYETLGTAFEPATSGATPAQIKTSKDIDQTKKIPFWSRWDLTTRVFILLALILPVVAIMTPNSSPSQFRLVTMVDDIPVKTTEGHPSLDNWKATIKSCVHNYVTMFSVDSDPLEVIATATQAEQLSLSFIHPLEFTSKNSTVRLSANQEKLAEICSTKGEGK